MQCKHNQRVNLSELMKSVWRMVQRFRAKGLIKQRADLLWRLSYELKQAWHAAKMAIHRALLVATQSAAGKAREALSMLENKTRWTQADFEEAGRLAGLARH